MTEISQGNVLVSKEKKMISLCFPIELVQYFLKEKSKTIVPFRILQDYA
jgi:hypothetical protein